MSLHHSAETRLIRLACFRTSDVSLSSSPPPQSSYSWPPSLVLIIQQISQPCLTSFFPFIKATLVTTVTLGPSFLQTCVRYVTDLEGSRFYPGRVLHESCENRLYQCEHTTRRTIYPRSPSTLPRLLTTISSSSAVAAAHREVVSRTS